MVAPIASSASDRAMIRTSPSVGQQNATWHVAKYQEKIKKEECTAALGRPRGGLWIVPSRSVEQPPKRFEINSSKSTRPVLNYAACLVAKAPTRGLGSCDEGGMIFISVQS
jgi:hypothetical protein